MGRRLRGPVGGLALLVVVTACGPHDASDRAPPWGTEAVRFVDALSAAYNDADLYGVLDFYAPTARVEKWRGDSRGGGLVSDVLRWNSGDLGQDVEGVFLGADGVLALVQWAATGDLGAVLDTVQEGRIVHEVVFDLAASLGPSQRAAPLAIASYEALYDAFARAWSGGDVDGLVLLYAPDASIGDLLSGVSVTGREAIQRLRQSGGPDYAAATVEGSNVPVGSRAVYLGPAEYGEDPHRAVGVYRVTDGDGCVHDLAVHWIVDGGLIQDEVRYWGAATGGRCAPDGSPTGWWTGLELPGPSDQMVTGRMRHPGGSIPVHNGTARLEGLVEWGLDRFAMAGLAEPRFDSLTFEPSRSCIGVSGRVVDNAGDRGLFICLYENDLCPGSGRCTEPVLSARAATLHELGHVWLLDQADEKTRVELLALTDRQTWQGGDVPWPDRGVEYAAEVLAWGLVDEPIPLVRLGSPPCAELAAAFRLLTAADPLRADCPNG